MKCVVRSLSCAAVVIAATLAPLPADGGQDSTPKTIAVANGLSILAAEVEAAAAETLRSLALKKAQFEIEIQRERQSVLENALDSVLEERALSAEAAKRNISVRDLLEIEVNRAAVAPTDEAVAAFYNANRTALQGSLGDNAASIRAYLGDRQRQSIHESFVQGLKTKYGAVSMIEPLRMDIPTDGRPARGPVDAPVTLVEFSDFECPYCRALSPTLQRVASDYKDQVRTVYLQFPLADIHPNALKAAEASLCALDQDKFWPMHDAMFADQTRLGVEDLKRKAAELSMDTHAFSTCLDTGKHFTRVRTDVGAGVKAGVTGTPALFINGRALLGNQPYEEIRRVIEDELRRTANRQP